MGRSQGVAAGAHAWPGVRRAGSPRWLGFALLLLVPSPSPHRQLVQQPDCQVCPRARLALA